MNMIKFISARSGRLTVCALLLIMISASSMANLIDNGGFENGTNGWTIATGGEVGAVIAANTAAQSLFSAGAAGLQMTDGTVNASQSIIRDFGAQPDGQYVFSFDFNMVALNTSGWMMRLRNSATADTSFDFQIANGYIRVGSTAVATGLSTGIWYHVAMTLDTVNDKSLGGSITPYGGLTTTWGEYAGIPGITAQIKQLIIIDASSANKAVSLYMDNFSLEAIPEPATAGLFLVAGVLARVLRRVFGRV